MKTNIIILKIDIISKYHNCYDKFEQSHINKNLLFGDFVPGSDKLQNFIFQNIADDCRLNKLYGNIEQWCGNYFHSFQSPILCKTFFAPPG